MVRVCMTLSMDLEKLVQSTREELQVSVKSIRMETTPLKSNLYENLMQEHITVLSHATQDNILKVQSFIFLRVSKI